MTVRHRLIVGILAGSALVVWPSTGLAQRVLYSAPHPILSLAATDRGLAWAEGRASGPGVGCFRIMRRPLVSGRPTPITRCRPFGNLGEDGVTDVELVGSRVFWSESDLGISHRDRSVYASTGIGTRTRVLDLEEPCGSGPCSPNSSGQVPGPMTAGHGALYYSIFAVSIDAMGNETVTGGSIHRAIVGPGGGARHPRLAGAPGAAFLAQAAGRVALVPADTSSRALRPLPSIQVRDDHTGVLAWSRPVTGTIEGLAISRRMVVALVGTAGDQAIRIYRPATGRLVAIIDVHQGVIAVACRGTHLAFAKARRVFLRRRSSTGTSIALVAHTRFRVSDLDVGRRLVTWHGRRTIQAVQI